jgi:hypothetical protein
MRKLLASLLICLAGCVSLTPEQEKWYARYVLDEHQPKLEVELKEPVTACALSVFIPGSGHLYLGEIRNSVIWYFVGLVLPFSSPPVAYADAETVNRRIIAEAYQQFCQEHAAQGYCPDCGWKGDPLQEFCPGCGHRKKRGMQAQVKIMK